MRLDEYLTQNKLAPSRSKAQQLIKQGLVFVDQKIADKASQEIKSQTVTVKEHKEYVSRGAYKLLGAVEQFSISLKDKVVLDIGASTGGFTQVALQCGAKKVYALDVGKNQLHPSLASLTQVCNLSQTDIRTLEKSQVLDVDFVTCDLSFISLTKVLPYVYSLFPNIPGVFLFKPQFECGKQIARKSGGVVKDKKLHISLLKEFLRFLKQQNLTLSGLIPSPIAGGDGNVEYLVFLQGGLDIEPNVENVVEQAFGNKKVLS